MSLSVINPMIFVQEKPWTNLGRQFENQPVSSEDMIRKADLNWTVAAAPMYSELHGQVKGYHVIYREDNNDILGVVNNARPVIVQNVETFEAIDSILGSKIDVETAAELSNGVNVFGCFLVKKQYNIFDDEIEHYYVIVNDHLKTDGKVTILNTPIRIVCQNSLATALSNNFYKMRIPITADKLTNKILADKILCHGDDAMMYLQRRADKLIKQKLSDAGFEKLMDELFPFVKVEGDSTYSKQNDKTEMIRDTFIKNCMGADNLANYAGTNWQIYNALTDFDTHYYSKVDKAYDLDFRMSKLPGLGTPAEVPKVIKFLRMADELAA